MLKNLHIGNLKQKELAVVASLPKMFEFYDTCNFRFFIV